MKIMYIDESDIIKIKKSLNLEQFLKDNKLIIISNYPYVIDDHFWFKDKLSILNNNSIMYIALGNLAVSINSKCEYLNYGPGFNFSDLISFPIQFYQEILKQKVSEILIESSNIKKCLNINKKDISKFNTADIATNVKSKYFDLKKRKLVFVAADGLFYGMNDEFDDMKEVTKEYLENGNILCLLSYTGAHNGFPFAVNKNFDNDTDNYRNHYITMLNYFKNMNILDDQVSNFKISHTGLNFKEDSYNFGFNWNNIEEFMIIYIDYLKKIGFNLDSIYLLDKAIDSYTITNTKNISDLYNLIIINDSESYNKVLKKIM